MALTNTEKADIIDQKIKAFEHQLYGSELDLLAENASDEPNTEFINTISSNITNAQSKIAALELKKSSL